MQPLSTNFAFLVAHDEGLARLGALAEWAFHDDPPTTLAKLRLFAELLAKLVAARHALEVLPRESFEAVLRCCATAASYPGSPPSSSIICAGSAMPRCTITWARRPRR